MRRNRHRGSRSSKAAAVMYWDHHLQVDFWSLELFLGPDLPPVLELFNSPLLVPLRRAEQESLSCGPRWSPSHGTGLSFLRPKRGL